MCSTMECSSWGSRRCRGCKRSCGWHGIVATAEGRRVKGTRRHGARYICCAHVDATTLPHGWFQLAREISELGVYHQRNHHGSVHFYKLRAVILPCPSHRANLQATNAERDRVTHCTTFGSRRGQHYTPIDLAWMLRSRPRPMSWFLMDGPKACSRP